MTQLFDFNNESRDVAEQLVNIKCELNEFHNSQEEDFDEVEKLNSDLIELANKTGGSLETEL